MLDLGNLTSLLFLNFHNQIKAGRIKTFNLSLLMMTLLWMQVFGLRQLSHFDFVNLDFRVPPPSLAKASRWQNQPRASLPWEPWAFPKCKTGHFCSLSCSTASEKGEITPSGSRIQSHLHPKKLRPTRARERALNLQASRCAPHLLFPEGTDPITHPMDTQTPPPELPTGVVGPQPPFFTANKVPGRQIPSKNPNLSKPTPIQDIPGAAKWILGAIIKQLIICSLATRKSSRVCGFQKKFCPLKKKKQKRTPILKTNWKNCACFEVLFLGKQQTPRSWVGSADATMNFEHF